MFVPKGFATADILWMAAEMQEYVDEVTIISNRLMLVAAWFAALITVVKTISVVNEVHAAANIVFFLALTALAGRAMYNNYKVME